MASHYKMDTTLLTDSVFVRVRYLDLSSSNLLPGRSLEEVGRDSWRLHGGQQQGDGAVHCLEGEGFVLKHLLIFCCELKQNTILTNLFNFSSLWLILISTTSPGLELKERSDDIWRTSCGFDLLYNTYVLKDELEMIIWSIVVWLQNTSYLHPARAKIPYQ